MMIRILLMSVVLCAVIVMTQCERGYCKNCRFIPYKRIKRGKYTGPPKRFYSRPPVNFPYIGAFSYTPPPNHYAEDTPLYSGPSSPYKVSKIHPRPSNDGLGDEDISNLMKHLTKQDLDKIIEFAYDKKKEERPYPNSLDNFSNQYKKYPKKREEIDVYKANSDDFATFEKFEKEISPPSEAKYTDNIRSVEKDQKYSFDNPYVDQKPYDNYVTEEPVNYVVQPSNTIKQYEIQDNTFQKQQEYLSFNKNVDQINNVAVESNNEYLPKPSNLRQDDYVASYTNNVPNVVKAEASAYKVEDFGNLPLMNYNSKLDTVSSYHVPHYTITTPTKHQAPSSSSSYSLSSSSSVKAPPIEAAPPVSAAIEQSDAHLKAVKIWSHRSKGTAYYLHNDGTLSLEIPTRSKGSYWPN